MAQTHLITTDTFNERAAEKYQAENVIYLFLPNVVFCLSATDVTLAKSSGIDALYLLHVHSVCMVLKRGIHMHVFT